MSNQAPYPWHTAYALALDGTDDTRLLGRVRTALQAIKERLKDPLIIGTPEHGEIETARQALAALKAERLFDAA